MTLIDRLTKSQRETIDAEQKRYNESQEKARKAGRDFDPLDDAPTPTDKDPVVSKKIQEIWYGNKTNG